MGVFNESKEIRYKHALKKKVKRNKKRNFAKVIL